MPENGGDSVTLSDVRNAMWRYVLTFQWSWNYERMQALGFAWSIFPVLRKVYRKKDKLIEAVQRHLAFYNTHPPVGGAIFGAAVAMEEKGAGGDAVDSLKVGLMGPFAGIGDTSYAILTRPIIGVFAASLALAGSIGGFWLMILFGIAWGLVIKIALFWFGYRQGMAIVGQVAGTGHLARITEGATIMGLTVIGGFIPSILRVTTPITFTRTVEVEGKVVEKTVELQSVLDQILPAMVPIILVALTYWMLKRLGLSPVVALLVLTVIAFGGSVLGIL